MNKPSGTFLTRALTRVRDWRGGDFAGVRPLSVGPSLGKPDQQVIRQQIKSCLEGRGGAVSARLRAAELGRAYLDLNDEGRLRFFELLAEHYEIDTAEVDRAAQELINAEDEEQRRGARARLKAALQAPRIDLFTQFNSLDHGVKFLVDMRADLLRLLRDNPHLRGVDEDLQRLLRAWFDVGFLEMAQITFNSPAALLEKLIAYEAVHEIKSWADLKNRLHSDRLCFSFMHPNMPDEPLIFVEVALVNGIADNVAELLDERAAPTEPTSADTAIFYSISNCQAGLAGVGFGDFLIKRVVDRLSRRLPNLKTFATLSPIPGFRRWLDGKLEGDGLDLPETDGRLIRAIARSTTSDEGLVRLLSVPGWPNDPDIVGAVKAPLERLAARYLVNEKDRKGRPLDPVARFHLTNGARVERLNWLADRSEGGMRQSAGMMVNYLYKLDDIERNHEAYRGEGRVIASSRIARMAKSA